MIMSKHSHFSQNKFKVWKNTNKTKKNLFNIICIISMLGIIRWLAKFPKNRMRLKLYSSVSEHPKCKTEQPVALKSKHLFDYFSK